MSVDRRIWVAVRGAVWLALAAVSASWAWAAEPPDGAAEVARELGALVGNAKGATRVAVVVDDVRTGQRWFEHNGNMPLKPASVLKLCTTAAALDRLGPDFKLATRVYLHGDELIVVGGGDPGLGDERLVERGAPVIDAVFKQWAESLRGQGLARVGDVIVDDSIFDRVWTHPDWPADQQDTWYQAPVGGLNLNDNCLDSRIVIRERVAQLVLRPNLPAELISNELSVSKQHKPTVTRKHGSDLFEFRGPVARATDLGPVSVGSPTIFFSFALREALEKNGIAVGGKVVRRAADATTLQAAKLLAVHETPLRDAIWRANTFSQNLFAECLLKAQAAYEPDGRRAAQPGSFERGAAQMRATLERLGVPTAGAEFRDGSGLSHDNRVTADMLVRLLRVMHGHRHREAFLASLARAGEEGSMKRRYGDGVFRGRLIGKTGTISGVSTFAGYATRDDGTTLAFAILVNGPAPENLPVRVSRGLVGR